VADIFPYESSLVKPPVLVTSTEDRSQYIISWPEQTNSYGYRVYAGFDPLHIRSLISGSDPLPNTTIGFTFNAPIFPPNQMVYFWVGSIGGTGATGVDFIDEQGSYTYRSNQYGAFATNPLSETSQLIMCGGDQLYFIEEMRRRSQAVLEDTGEYADLFIKQWRGLPDPSVQEELGLDPNYQAHSRDDKSYGTGFYPGYFPAIRIKLRFGGLPSSQLDYQSPGMRPLSDTMAWTIWDPLMHENDLLVRPNTGQRYVIKEISFSNYRSVPITQRMTLSIVTPTSPLQGITDQAIREKWNAIDELQYLKVGFSVLPGATGAADYMIFS
jgi:hypothetical protein